MDTTELNLNRSQNAALFVDSADSVHEGQRGQTRSMKRSGVIRLHCQVQLCFEHIHPKDERAQLRGVHALEMLV